jgi:hypothetical protein
MVAATASVPLGVQEIALVRAADVSAVGVMP